MAGLTEAWAGNPTRGSTGMDETWVGAWGKQTHGGECRLTEHTCYARRLL